MFSNLYPGNPMILRNLVIPHIYLIPSKITVKFPADIISLQDILRSDDTSHMLLPSKKSASKVRRDRDFSTCIT
jgi:hypothetical protein